MEKERKEKNRKSESLFGPGAIPKENVQRISTYKPNLDQIDLSLISASRILHMLFSSLHILWGRCPARILYSSWLSDARPLLMPPAPHILPRASLATLSYTKPRVQNNCSNHVFSHDDIFLAFSRQRVASESLFVWPVSLRSFRKCLRFYIACEEYIRANSARLSFVYSSAWVSCCMKYCNASKLHAPTWSYTYSFRFIKYIITLHVSLRPPAAY